MPEFMFTGKARLRGVIFFIEAATEAEAIARARKNECDNLDAGGAETVDWEINPSTCELNE